MFETKLQSDGTLEFDYIPCLDWIHSLRRPFDFRGLKEMEKESATWRDVLCWRPDVQDWFDEMIRNYHMLNE